MNRLHLACVAALVLIPFAGTSAAQSVPAETLAIPRAVMVEPLTATAGQAGSGGTARRDSLLNGTLIGAAAGAAAAATLDEIFCDSGDGRCDFPWKAYLVLGGIGAAAGAGIDFLIGRDRDDTKTSLRLAPVVGRQAKGVRVSLRF